ncbi:MAG TPA: DUF883 C-terminal domain-containing protein [Methylophilus sp.]
MFNLKKDEIKTTSEQLAHDGRVAVDHVAEQVKASAENAADKVAEKSEDLKGQANHLIGSLKNVIQDYTNASKIEDITDKAAALKTAVTDEFNNVYSAGRSKAEVAVKENPLATLAIVAGAGLLIGYLLGTKQSSK